MHIRWNCDLLSITLRKIARHVSMHALGREHNTLSTRFLPGGVGLCTMSASNHFEQVYQDTLANLVLSPCIY